MIDELELAFDEHAERGGNGRYRGTRRRNGRKRGGGRGSTVIALVMAFVLLGGLGAGAWYGFDRIMGLVSAPDYAGGGSGEVTIEVKAGETATEIGNTLVTAGVVKSAKAFIEAAQSNSRSQNIQPGFYKLRKEMRAETALQLLLDLKNKVTNQLTIPEGLTAKQVYLRLEKQTKIPVKEFEAAAKDPIALGVPDFWFKRSDGKKVTKSIEGFLFPDTYEFGPDSTAESILKTMVQGFVNTTGELEFADRVARERGGISPYEALIVASLAQAEAGNANDLGKVARVAYNRVYGDFPCNCLQFDVTLNYYFELTGKKTKSSKALTRDELQDESNPYNMHVRSGLPPTPINNPGKQAMEGAMDPPKGNWLYFVAVDKQGNSEFTNDYNQHLRNEQKARENGVL